MGRKAVRKLVKKAPKLIFTIATSTNQNQTQKNKKNKKNLSYVVNDDVLKLMRKQLADIGCKLHEVKGDGNCLFRALSDQLFGDQQQYQQVREKIVNYLEQHRNDFEPFMEDEEKFEKYCDRMRDNGTWGGNQELYAAARLFQVYIIVHQNQPSARIMVIECDQLKPTRVIHVAYHGEDHYDSVRAITDPVEPGSLPVSIELDCNGFRSEEFAKRWQTQATPVASDEQRVVPKSSIDPADGEIDQIDQLASSLGEQLQIAARTGNDVAKMTLSKKEKRQMRKVAKAASRSARKLQSTLK